MSAQPTDDLPQATLDTPNERPALQRFWISSLGHMMQASFFLMTVAADLRIRNRGDVERISTTIHTGATGKCGLLIYVPKTLAPSQEAKPRGVVVHLHGSGWTVGRPQFEHEAAQRMAHELGTVVVSPNYKKAPQHPYPFALCQMHAVLDWIASGGLSGALKKHAGFPLDTTRIAISGGSAGGNLAASLALLTQKKPLANDAHIVALGLLYPLLDAATPFEDKLKAMGEARKEIALPPWVSKFFLKAYLPPPRNSSDPYVSPLRAPRDRLAAFPPTVVATASMDYLAAEGDRFAQALEKEGVETHHVRCEGVKHAFDLDPGFSKAQKEKNRAAVNASWGAVIELFRRTLTA